MIGMILEGCKDLEEAKKKIEELRAGKKEKMTSSFKSGLKPLFLFHRSGESKDMSPQH